MSGIVGETFEDYGNAEECVIDSIPAYEVLDTGLIRIFVCKTSNKRHILDHTDIMTRGTLVAIGQRLLEIANAASIVSEPTHWIEGHKTH